MVFIKWDYGALYASLKGTGNFPRPSRKSSSVQATSLPIDNPSFPAIIVVIVTGGVYYSRRLENPEFYYGRMKDAAIV